MLLVKNLFVCLDPDLLDLKIDFRKVQISLIAMKKKLLNKLRYVAHTFTVLLQANARPKIYFEVPGKKLNFLKHSAVFIF